MEKKNDAVSPVISAILALLIVSSTMATVFVWGVPYINQLNTTTSIENSAKQFASVIDSIGDLTNSNPNESRIDTLSIDKGEVSAGTDEGGKDRTVITYSYDDDHNFSVSRLDTCFLTGTKVLMADRSYKNIEDIKIGDKVLSYDEPTGKIVTCKVAKVFSHSPREMSDYYLLINDGLRVTPNHRFYSDGKLVYAGNLKIGDLLFSQDQNSNYQVYSIKKIYEREQSFDLEVENCHTYFVSVPNDGVDILVHNGNEQQEPSYPIDAGGPYFGYINEPVQFHGTQNGCPCYGQDLPVVFQWDFDDDGEYESIGQNPTYTFSTVGTYTVTLEVHCNGNPIETSETDTAIVRIYTPLNLTNAKDTHIMQTVFPLDDPAYGNNYGNDIELHVDSQNEGLEHTLIRFDLSIIPSGSTITMAKLRLYYFGWEHHNPGTTNPKKKIGCYRITSNWSEHDDYENANWYNRSYDYYYNRNVPWDNMAEGGGDFVSSPTFSIDMPNIPSSGGGQWIEWDVKSDMQGFIDGYYANYGWLMRYDSVTPAYSYFAKFYSKEHVSLTPQLHISYLKTETLNATNVKKYSANYASATLNGNIISDGYNGCIYGFYYKRFSDSTWSKWWSSDIKGTGETFSLNKGLLSPGTLYIYKASIKNSSFNLVNNGSEMKFLTPGNITNINAQAVNPGEIDLSWQLVPGDGADGAYIEWSTSPHATWNPGSYNKTNTNGYCPGTSFQHTGLTPGKTYYYKAWAYAEDGGWKSNGIGNNAIAPFGNTMIISAITHQAPYLLTNNATLVHSRDATLNGYLTQTSPRTNCKVWFEYGLTTAFGTSTTPKWMNSTGTFNTTISGLKPNTKYYFCAVYQNLSYIFKAWPKNFTTILGGIEIVSPQYGDNWKRGTTHEIQWFYGPQVTGTVYIALYGGPKGNVLSIANVSIDSNGGNGAGSYNWNIPPNQPIGKFNYRIKITSNFDPSIYDYSDYFSIKELHEGTVWNETISPLHVNTQGNVEVSLFSCGVSFNLTMIEGNVDKAEVYWLYYGGEINLCSFSGAVQIDLYESGSCFGTIIILDSDSLTYESQSDSGPYSTTIENGGIFYSDTNTNKYLQKAPPIYEGKHTFSMHAVQLVASPFGAGGTGGFKIRMKTIVNINSVRETDYVYNLRLQFYGDNAEAWLDYFESNYDFEKQQSQPYHTPDTLFYKPSTSRLWFTFAHSAIGVSFQ